MLLFSIQANPCRNARLTGSKPGLQPLLVMPVGRERTWWAWRVSGPRVRELLTGVTTAPGSLLPYLALDFHPRSLVSDLLQNEGIHQEWEVNPSFLLHKEQNTTLTRCVRCVPNSDLHSPALHGASVLSTYLVGHPDLCPGGLFHGQLPQKHQSSPLDRSHQDQESHPFLGGEPGLHVSGGLLF